MNTPTFLGSVAEELSRSLKNFEDVQLITPTWRAGVFLQKELSRQITRATYLPELNNMESFAVNMSGFRLLNPAALLLEFYELCSRMQTTEGETLSFQQFARWAADALRDFDEIDRQFINGNQLFSQLARLKEVEQWDLGSQKTTAQENYLHFWKQLSEYYHAFRTQLLQKKCAYPGLAYQQACEQAEDYLAKHPARRHFFIGFNALSRTEERLIQMFLEQEGNEIFWDIDNCFLEDETHEAGFFLRNYRKTWAHFKTHPFRSFSGDFRAEKNIRLIGVPKQNPQAAYVGKLLREEPIDNGKTAIILGDETLLLPLLHTLPESTLPVNIYSKLPLHQTPLASFFTAWWTLAEQVQDGWQPSQLQTLLYHPITQQIVSGGIKIALFNSKIHEKNVFSYSPETLLREFPAALQPLLKQLLPISTSSSELLEQALIILERMQKTYKNQPLYPEYISQFQYLFNQLAAIAQTHSIEIPALAILYRQLLKSETIHFKSGFNGLSIMGLWESRCLDFERVIITSVNEGLLPPGKKESSLIPYELRRAFGLPTHVERDAAYSYHFYRLLQRAKTVILLYDLEMDMMGGGEKSRFLLQLSMFPQTRHIISETIASPPVLPISVQPISVPKTPRLLNDLAMVMEKGISPTALIAYLRNPLDFYHRTLLAVTPPEDTEESVSARTLGIIIHYTLETLYKPLEGSFLEMNTLLEMEKRVEELILDKFKQFYGENPAENGKNRIAIAIAGRYIERFLEMEKQRLQKKTAVKILLIEQPVAASFILPELSQTVRLTGTIDRLEEVNGMLHLLDYKTGKALQRELQVTIGVNLASYPYHKAFQLLTYSWLYEKTYSLQKPMEASIISFKNMGQGFMNFCLKDKPGRTALKNTQIDASVLEWYEQALTNLLYEIFNPAIPFMQKEAGVQKGSE